jgi:hypothetical protein
VPDEPPVLELPVVDPPDDPLDDEPARSRIVGVLYAPMPVALPVPPAPEPLSGVVLFMPLAVEPEDELPLMLLPVELQAARPRASRPPTNTLW